MHEFPDPRADVIAVLTTAKAAHFPTATVGSAVGSGGLHLQVIWDGTPSEQSNRQVCAVAVVAWSGKGKVSESITLAQRARAVLLDAMTTATWRFRPGPGPQPDTDEASGLPRCEFTVYAETRPTPVAP